MIRVLLTAMIVVGLCGCQAASPRLSSTTQPAVPTEGNGALAEYIADQPYLTAEPAFRAVYILSNGTVFEGDYGTLAGQLQADGLIKSADIPPDALLSRSTVGYLLCKACDVQTGLNWKLTGLGRYAWRELNYLGIASPIGEYGYVPGGQFIGMLARCEDYMHRIQKDGEERVELGAEP
ncbi:MAG: hypothetical protein ABIG44_17315 [Planctomycetota bacterium]